MPNFRFKIQIQGEDGKKRWADADKVFAHLLEEYTKKIPNGEKPKPYKDKVENFFDTMDVDWLNSLKKAYSNVDIDLELNRCKMWLLSNTPKRNFKKFLNNWMSKAMGNKENKKTEAAKYEKYVKPIINEDDVASPEEIRELLRRNR